MGMRITSAHASRYARPQLGWITLGKKRFHFSSVPLETNGQWLDFWERVARQAITRSIWNTEIGVQRFSRDQRRLVRVIAGQDDLRFDGESGRAYLTSKGRVVEWGCAEACLSWRISKECLWFGGRCGELCEIAEDLLNRSALGLQAAMERQQISVWARPDPGSDFQEIAPDRWRLYKVRPLTTMNVDADGPDGTVLYSVHIDVSGPLVQPSDAPLIPQKPTETNRKVLPDEGLRKANSERRRGAPPMYDWPTIENHARQLLTSFRGLPDRSKPSWTKTKFRDHLLTICDEQGLGIPSTSQVDDHINPIIKELEKSRSPHNLRQSGK
ncbi:MAG: hypothetical protein H0V72_17620 [Bradyrhizobium sp.]|nr:hypothetical protein [Bradyrhizobium sp.]